MNLSVRNWFQNPVSWTRICFGYESLKGLDFSQFSRWNYLAEFFRSTWLAIDGLISNTKQNTRYLRFKEKVKTLIIGLYIKKISLH